MKNICFLKILARTQYLKIDLDWYYNFRNPISMYFKQPGTLFLKILLRLISYVAKLIIFEELNDTFRSKTSNLSQNIRTGPLVALLPQCKCATPPPPSEKVILPKIIFKIYLRALDNNLS